MTKNLGIDFETRSRLELKLVGLDNYARNAEVLMLAWGFEGEPVELWLPEDSMPERLQKALDDSDVNLIAWNCAFERNIFRYCLGREIPIERWHDPQASARYLSLPGSLKEVGEILGLPENLQKDKKGEQLINIFSKPTVPRKKKNQTEDPIPFFRDRNSDPELFKEFQEYCKQDVCAEFEILRRLRLLQVYPLPPLERKVFVLDQKINDRGIPVDVQFVKSALKLADREKQEMIEAQNKLTGLENANSNLQMLEWAKTQGFEGNSLRKGAVEAALKYNEKLTPLGRQVLEARKAASSTSYKKLSAILRQVSPDGRLRNQFIYLGSSRCGRWSGSTVQMQNLARPMKLKGYDFEQLNVVDDARKLIYEENYEKIKEKYGSVLLVIKSLIRTAFVASEN